MALIQSLGCLTPATLRHHKPRKYAVQQGGKRQVIEFDTRSLDILASQSTCLNDTCINGCAALLQHLFAQASPGTASACAIFNSFDLERDRHHPIPFVWRHVQHLDYWAKPIWILPVHRKLPVEHWAVCAIFPQHHFILFFDSIADHEACSSKLLVSFPSANCICPYR